MVDVLRPKKWCILKASLQAGHDSAAAWLHQLMRMLTGVKVTRTGRRDKKERKSRRRDEKVKNKAMQCGNMVLCLESWPIRQQDALKFGMSTIGSCLFSANASQHKEKDCSVQGETIGAGAWQRNQQ